METPRVEVIRLEPGQRFRFVDRLLTVRDVVVGGPTPMLVRVATVEGPMPSYTTADDVEVPDGERAPPPSGRRRPPGGWGARRGGRIRFGGASMSKPAATESVRHPVNA